MAAAVCAYVFICTYGQPSNIMTGTELMMMTGLTVLLLLDDDTIEKQKQGKGRKVEACNSVIVTPISLSHYLRCNCHEKSGRALPTEIEPFMLTYGIMTPT